MANTQPTKKGIFHQKEYSLAPHQIALRPIVGGGFILEEQHFQWKVKISHWPVISCHTLNTTTRCLRAR